jgi:hypothetical protein
MKTKELNPKIARINNLASKVIPGQETGGPEASGATPENVRAACFALLLLLRQV